ncbi:50S ribosomal protein L7/L12-serine acetyltransferase [Mangrovibacter plantisponsor]|uniref:[LSU ribosomal protein L12P]-serine N-acetyltransferase n=1 Tax=Mangrovibacter plantisponsor TaxID=451513 RepID=A0A317Q674_9ENTR|nr:50S ribosomal protein L7/L12-serine acetyltransferase [Mangrovibacter plantisponsor]PWW10801.1 [LSU ribosomal protein L12P]-serine N-acetyltransferase [Mangrovibacter plantisponsor]
MNTPQSWQDEVISVDSHIQLHSVHERFVDPLFELILRNKDWLQQSMNWPQFVNAREDTVKTVQGNYLLHHRNITKMFMILSKSKLVGVVSFNLIEPTNKAAYIGYWLDEAAQGKGILSRSLNAMMMKYAREGLVRRFVIKCIVTNTASNQVARRNGFTLEGRLREAEFLNGEYHDQNIYGRIIDASQANKAE